MRHISFRVPKLETKNSREVFTLFAALNAMGYDDENSPRGMSPIRKRVRAALRQHDWRKAYPQLARATKQHHPWRLLRAILTKQKSAFGLKQFSREPRVREQWNIFIPYQLREIKKMNSLFKKEVVRLSKFIGKLPRGLMKIIFFPNLLDAYWRGYSFRIRGTGYIVVGPGAEKNQGGLIRHELLHILTPPLRVPQRFTVSFPRTRLAAAGYGDRRIINREYIVRSLNLLYESRILKKNILRAIRKEKNDFPYIKETIEFIKTKIKMGLPVKTAPLRR